MDAYEKKIAKLEESNKKLQEELTNSKMKKLRQKLLFFKVYLIIRNNIPDTTKIINFLI